MKILKDAEERRQSIGILLVGVGIVSAGGLFARLGMNHGAGGFELALWRVTVAAILLGIYGRVRPASPRPPFQPAEIRGLMVSGLFMAIHFATWLTSLRYVSVARSTLMVSTSPLWAGLAGLVIPALRPKRGFWRGLLLALAGAALFLGTGAAAAISPGDLWAIAGAVAIVPYLQYSKRIQANHETIRTVTWIYAIAAGCLWGFGLATGQAAMPKSPLIWIGILGMAILSQMVGHTLLNRAVRSFTAAQVTTATLLEPVFAALLAWPLFGETVGIGQVAGGVLVLFGVARTLQSIG